MNEIIIMMMKYILMKRQNIIGNINGDTDIDIVLKLTLRLRLRLQTAIKDVLKLKRKKEKKWRKMMIPQLKKEETQVIDYTESYLLCVEKNEEK